MGKNPLNHARIVDRGDQLHPPGAARTAQDVQLVRAPWNDPATIMKALDLGACGILVPLSAGGHALVRAGARRATARPQLPCDYGREA